MRTSMQENRAVNVVSQPGDQQNREAGLKGVTISQSQTVALERVQTEAAFEQSGETFDVATLTLVTPKLSGPVKRDDNLLARIARDVDDLCVACKTAVQSLGGIIYSPHGGTLQ